MIELKNIKKTYRSKKGVTTEVLKGIDLQLPDKGFIFILGKSGSGKSTLLNIIGGLDNYSSGEIVINGISTKNYKEKDWDAYRNTYMGFIFQEYNLLDSYNIFENIKISLELQHQKVTKEQVLETLKLVDLEDILKRKTNELSGGQKQRIAIARALIKNPEIILADEPTGNLDSATSEQIFTLLKKLSKNKLVVVVSHNEEAAFSYADRIIKIKDGLIVEDNGKVEIEQNKKTHQPIFASFPFSYSLKMGVSNLFKRKVKLIFTFISLCICFLCLGFTISISNSSLEKEFIKEFNKKGPTEIYLQKYSRVIDYKKVVKDLLNYAANDEENASSMDDILPQPIPFKEELIADFEKSTNLKWEPIFVINLQGNYASLGEYDDSIKSYYEYNVITFAYNSAITNTENLYGKVNEEDMIITSYLADYIMDYGVKAKRNKEEQTDFLYKPTSYEQIINDHYYIKINNLDYFIISGIYKINTTAYTKLKEVTLKELDDLNYTDSKKHNEYYAVYNDFVKDNSLARIYLPKNKITEYKNKVNNISYGDNFGSEKIKYNNEIYSAYQYGYLLENSEIYDGITSKRINELTNKEIVINNKMLNEITNGDYKEKLLDYLIANPSSSEKEYLNTYLTNNKIFQKELKSNIIDNHVYLAENNYVNYTLIGVIFDDIENPTIYFPKKEVDKLIMEPVLLKYAVRYVESEEELKNILKVYPLDGSDILSYSVYAGFIQDSVLGNYILGIIGQVGTIIFGIISFIFIANFIGGSIKARRKEIGIFRALGCCNKNLIMIFITESMCLLLLCIIISSIVLPFLCNFMNYIARTYMFHNMDISNFGINCLLFMFLYASVLTVLITILSLLKLLKQKPIDTILEK